MFDLLSKAPLGVFSSYVFMSASARADQLH
uniref:Uncharacterized protein n=1 Tax=Anguilla anguilla TaxID=7936 RepID=A0A0E9W0X9_ANGAN